MKLTRLFALLLLLFLAGCSHVLGPTSKVFVFKPLPPEPTQTQPVKEYCVQIGCNKLDCHLNPPADAVFVCNTENK